MVKWEDTVAKMRAEIAQALLYVTSRASKRLFRETSDPLGLKSHAQERADRETTEETLLKLLEAGRHSCFP